MKSFSATWGIFPTLGFLPAASVGYLPCKLFLGKRKQMETSELPKVLNDLSTAALPPSPVKICLNANS